MPRGVYDRSKMKKNKAEKTEVAPAAPKGKPGRKPGRKAGATASAVKQPALGGQGVAVYQGSDVFLLSEVRNNLVTLNILAERFTDIPAIKAEITANVEAMGTLRKQIFGTKEVQVSNGATQATAYPATVPMPPAPVPSIPATH